MVLPRVQATSLCLAIYIYMINDVLNFAFILLFIFRIFRILARKLFKSIGNDRERQFFLNDNPDSYMSRGVILIAL